MIPPKKFKLVMSPNAYNFRQKSNAFFPPMKLVKFSLVLVIKLWWLVREQ